MDSTFHARTARRRPWTYTAAGAVLAAAEGANQRRPLTRRRRGVGVRASVAATGCGTAGLQMTAPLDVSPFSGAERNRACGRRRPCTVAAARSRKRRGQLSKFLSTSSCQWRDAGKKNSNNDEPVAAKGFRSGQHLHVACNCVIVAKSCPSERRRRAGTRCRC